MNKLIREARMGLPKSFKTGAVLASYPKPLLYLGFDRGGVDVVPVANSPAPALQFDTLHGEIEHIKPGELGQRVTQEKQPKILAVDYTVNQTMSLDTNLRPAAAQQPLQSFIADYNAVSAHINSGKPLPWKTAVLDSVTGYEDLVLSFISSSNPNAMLDARAWAGQTGGMVRRTILTFTTWPCHICVIMHAMLDKNDLTGTVSELPSVFSAGLRTDIGGLFSQFLYQSKVNGVPKIWSTDKGYVRGIGARWPIIPPESDPDFKSLYGKELS